MIVRLAVLIFACGIITWIAIKMRIRRVKQNVKRAYIEMVESYHEMISAIQKLKRS